MNELLSEEIPYGNGNISHDDYDLAIKICRGFRPKISEDTPKLLADLIIKCWHINAENRPTAKELNQILKKWNIECGDNGNSECDYSSEIYIKIKKCEKIRKSKSKSSSNKNNS